MIRPPGPRPSRLKPRRPRPEPLEARALLTLGFDPTYLPSAGSGVALVASADFTGDGVPDLVQADAAGADQPSTLTVRVGRADGSYGDPFEIGRFQDPIRAIAPGDFNGDGLTDVAVVGLSGGSSSARVLLNRGNGVFSALPTALFDYGDRTAIAADVDGDGKLDLVTDSRIFRGNGDGTFAVQTSFVGNPNDPINDRVVADLNGDGRPDLVTAVGVGPASEDGRIEVLLNLGGGSFGGAITVPYDAVTSRFGGLIDPEHLAVADFNNDGKPDLAVGDRAVRVLLGRGDGTFGAGPIYDIGEGPGNLVAADFDGDGRVDLATVGQTSGVANVILGNGDGTFQAGRFAPRPDRVTPSLLADVNGDGVPDLLGVTVYDLDGGPDLTVQLGRGDGTLAPTILTPIDPNTGGSAGFAVGDVNGDGIPDVVAYSLAPEPAAWTPSVTRPDRGRTVLLGRGDGTFTALPTEFRPISAPQSVELADVDGDGRLDLIEVGDRGHSSDPQVVRVSLGNGDGTFAEPTVIDLGMGGVSGLAVGRLDDDNRPDLAVADFLGGSVHVLLNQSTPGVVRFGSAQVYLTGDSPAAVEILDMDGDGRNDLAVLNRGALVGGSFYNTGVVLLRNLGGGSFGPASTIDVPPTSMKFFQSSLSQGDINGDGRPDLVARYDSNDPYIYSGDIHVIAAINRPGGTPAVNTTVVTQSTSDAFVGDFNGDGFGDILTVTNGSASTIYANRGDGTFNQPLRFAVTPGAGPLLAADVDGDGIPDLITFSPGTGRATVLRNTTAPAARPFTVTRLSLPDLVPSDTAGEWTLADLRDLNPQAKAGDYRVSVDWGDGSPVDSATLFSLDPGRFAIQGRHAYARPGQYAVRVTVLNVPSNRSSNFLTPVTVAAGPSGPIDGNPLPVPVDPPIILPPALPPPPLPPAPVLTGGMDPRSDTGASAGDRITRDDRPVFRGVADPGARIELFVQRIDPSGTIGEFSRVGTAEAGADGAWSVQASALSDGAYIVTVLASPIGNVQTLITVAPAAQPLRIDTAGPTIAEVTVGSRKGQVIVRFADAGGLALPGPARQAALYRVGQGSLTRRWAVTGVTALDAQAVRLTLRKGRAIPVGTRLAVRVDPGAIVDAAGNPLDPASRRAVKVRAGQVHPAMARRSGRR